MTAPFRGAKLAVLSRGRLLALQRDDILTIPFPGMWDLPGGGREGGEGPLDCALRETREELGLVIVPALVGWGRRYPHWSGRGSSWLFACELPDLDEASIRLGDEGQGWALMGVAEFRAHPGVIPHLAARLGDYLGA